jgi:hypothetical protein
MFSMTIVDTDAFLEMPQTSQLLYFHLSMRADDDGFVGSPRKIMRMCGFGEDDLKVLLTKRFLLAFESGVVVIKHWLIHNTIRKDRYTPTTYQLEKNQLKIKENKAYTDNVNHLATKRQPSIEKDRIEKDRIEEKVSAEAETSLEPVKETFKTKKKIFEQRGQKYTPRIKTEKQQKAIDAFKGILDYFRERGQNEHGMQFFQVKDESRNAAVRKLAIRMYETLESAEECQKMIDWWFEGAGEWAQYEPENMMASKTIEKFINRNKSNQVKTLKL